jgi:hypothetical protein
MQNPPEYIYLINQMLEKRRVTEGFNSDIILDISILDKKFIANETKLFRMLSHFIKDKVVVEGIKEAVIDTYTVNGNDLTIINSTTDKLNAYLSKIENNDIKKIPINNDSYYLRVINGNGFLLFNNKSIKIGGVETRKFKLLRTLFDPHFGVMKSPEQVMEDIWLANDRLNSSLTNYRESPVERKKIIKTTFKEISRPKEYQDASPPLKLNYEQHRVWFS